MQVRDAVLLATGLGVGVSPWLMNSGTGIPFVAGAALVAALAGASARQLSLASLAPALAPLIYVVPRRVLWEIQVRGEGALATLPLVLLFSLGAAGFFWSTGWLTYGALRRRPRGEHKRLPDGQDSDRTGAAEAEQPHGN